MLTELLLTFVVLVWIPAAALVGGLLTREGRPPGQFVARHLWVLSTAIWLLVAVATLVFRHDDSSLSTAMRIGTWTVCAAMFMPSLRQLEGRMRQSNRSLSS